MKVSLRFEKLMHQRRCQPDAERLNDAELLGEIVTKYNSYKANKALKRWQVTPDKHQAMLGIIVGMCPTARDLVRAHLDFNKWESSGT